MKCLELYDFGGKDYYPFGMGMPARDFSYGDGYKYGFNGKESDDETYGDGNVYDYGFRIYNPRLAKFLSKDPLISTFTSLTPYQFASNSPISGVDLDGLEYLNKDEARIEVVNGLVLLKVENFYRYNRNTFNANNNNPQNWSLNPSTGFKDIGISRAVAYVSYVLPPPTGALPKQDATFMKWTGLEGGYNSPDAGWFGQDFAKIEGTPTKANGTPDMRYKANKINQSGGVPLATAPTASSTGLATGALVVNAINLGFDIYCFGIWLNDSKKINSGLGVLDLAAEDLQIALNSGDKYIPEKYRNVEDLSAILNVILQGDNPSDNPELYDIGIKIYNEVSLSKVQFYNIEYTGGENGLDGFKGSEVYIPTIKLSDIQIKQ